jgi:transposase-like protein
MTNSAMTDNAHTTDDEPTSTRPTRPRRKYTPEFKREAVRIASESPHKSLVEIGKELDISPTVLGNWIAGKHIGSATPRAKHTNHDHLAAVLNIETPAVDASQLDTLHAENTALRAERDALMRALVLLAHDNAN